MGLKKIQKEFQKKKAVIVGWLSIAQNNDCKKKRQRAEQAG